MFSKKNNVLYFTNQIRLGIDNPNFDVFIDGGDDKDEIIVMNSRIEEVRGGAGSDMITIESLAGKKYQYKNKLKMSIKKIIILFMCRRS